MNLEDTIPVFILVFYYVLPMLLITIITVIAYKYIKKTTSKFFTIKKNAEEQSNQGDKMVYLMREITNTIFMDTIPTFLILYPAVLMVFMLITQNSLWMLEHFWDYVYPSLGVLSFSMAANIWANTIYYFFKEVMRF